MLQTFLDFARPPQPAKQVVDVGAMLKNSVEFVIPRAAQQEVQFHYDVPREPVDAEIDTSQMRQVLLNLFINALDAMPAGGNVWVEVESSPQPADREKPGTPAQRAASYLRSPSANRAHQMSTGQNATWVVIRVWDDGPGVALDVIDRVFEPFVSTKVTGIGLGLSISRRIVESHAGRINARNLDSGGAEFTIYLPSCPPDRHVMPDGMATGQRRPSLLTSSTRN